MASRWMPNAAPCSADPLFPEELKGLSVFLAWQVNTRRRAEAETLASLTARTPESIREHMGKDAPKVHAPRWYQKLWK